MTVVIGDILTKLDEPNRIFAVCGLSNGTVDLIDVRGRVDVKLQSSLNHHYAPGDNINHPDYEKIRQVYRSFIVPFQKGSYWVDSADNLYQHWERNEGAQVFVNKNGECEKFYHPIDLKYTEDHFNHKDYQAVTKAFIELTLERELD